MEKVLEIKNLEKNYGRSRVLKNVNLSLEKGKIYGFIGKNGSGKTTLFRIISGLIVNYSGDIKILGDDNLKKRRDRIGGLIDSPIYYPDMTGFDNLKMQLLNAGVPSDDNEIFELLEMVKLKNDEKKVKNYSLGMKQRLAIAIAIISSPEILLLDEPINGLDPEGIFEITALIRNLSKKRDMTIMVSSHLLSQLYDLASEFIFINEGIIIEEINKEELDKKCRKHIYLTVDNTAVAIPILEQKLKVDDYIVDEKNCIKIYDTEMDRSQLNRELVLNGISVLDMSMRGDSLEDYYLDMIGGGIKDE